MSLTKKKKFLLKWAAPASFLVLGIALATPIVVVSQQNNEKLVKSSENIVPSFLSDESKLNSLKYNPKKYDLNFFNEKIINNPFLRNEVFVFNGANFIVEEKKAYWKDSNGVCYYVDKATILDANTIELNIYKYKKGAIQIKYSEKISIPANYFVSEEQSLKNFLASSAKKLNEIFADKEEILTLKAEGFTNIEELTNANEIKLVENNENADNYIKSYHKPNNDTYYALEWDDFFYNSFVNFSIPFSSGSQKLVWNSTDIFDQTTGEFNKNSTLFRLFKEVIYRGGWISESNLPELTDEEKKGLTTEDQIIDRQIQKLIFNPEIQPHATVKNGNKINKIPILNQAVLLEVSLKNQTTYIVVWTNLFPVSDFIIEEATELKFKANMKDGKLLTSDQIQEKNNWGYIVPIEKPKNGLVYEITKISFAENDTYKVNPIVDIKISHPRLQVTKEYQTTIISGFQSNAYQELDSKITAILNNNSSTT
ncbi:MAG: hypothetical protein IJ970_00280, partial [Mycoplasmataceae bacterium]|nr:hypothetical protein [Mycoplasmataceae bacterium]